MKKIFYGIALFGLMFFGISNVMAAGSVDVSTLSLKIESGKTKTFDIVVTNAIARANITSLNTSVATVNPNGKWISPMDGAGKENLETVTVTAVGAVGTKTTIEVEIYDASTFDETPIKLASNSNKIIKKIEVEIIEASGTVTPQPTVKEYTVTYDANGGKNAPTVQTKKENVDLVLSNVKPTKDGYTFVEWNTKKDGTGTKYAVSGKYTANANVTLYAIWQSSKNVDKNPQTGESSLLIIMAILVTFGGYAYWYTKKVKEN